MIQVEIEKIIIITDDSVDCPNTYLLLDSLRSIGKEAILYLTKKKISAKSSAISLEPIKIEQNGIITIMDGFPADCLLYCIFNSKITPEDTLFIFGINEHNHFGYGNYVSSTTSLLQLAKLFNFKAFAISSEIKLDKRYCQNFYFYATGIVFNSKNYSCFNINKMDLIFKSAKISDRKIDNYEYLETNRGPFLLITYNQEPKIFNEGTDGYYQVNKKNYIVNLF